MFSNFNGRLLRTTMCVLLEALGLAAAESAVSPRGGAPVAYEVDRTSYRNFVSNWDAKAHPVVMAYIQSPKQYRLVFHPAPVMFEKCLFEPDPTLYETKAIVVVARVFTLTGDELANDDPFEVQSITKKNGVLIVSYTIHAGWVISNGETNRHPCTSGNTRISLGKRSISLVVPRTAISKVALIENGVEVGNLNIAAGTWISPTSPFILGGGHP